MLIMWKTTLDFVKDTTVTTMKSMHNRKSIGKLYITVICCYLVYINYTTKERQDVECTNSANYNRTTLHGTHSDSPTTKHIADYLTDINITLAQKYHVDVNKDFMFPYMINNEEVCSGVHNLYYLILVLVAPTQDGYHRRQAIRKTWGQKDFLRTHPSRTVFLLGNIYNTDKQDELEKEHEIYKDIIQADFKDSYHNLTMKLLMGVKWSLQYCNNTKFLLRANDDVFLDIMVLNRVLSAQFGTAKRSMIGFYHLHSPIIWDTGSCGKWCVSVKDIKGRTKFPKYLQGSFYILTSDLLEDLYKTAVKLKYFWIEDSFITGFVREAMDRVNYLNTETYFQFNEYTFMQNCARQVSSRTHFVTITDTYYGTFMVCMSGMSQEDKTFIGHARHSALLRSFTRRSN